MIPFSSAWRGFLARALALALGSVASASDFSRPSAESGPTEVRVSISVLDISGVNDTAQTITGNVFFRARWRDTRLAGNGTGPRTAGLDDIWHPRLQVFNDAGTRMTLPGEVEIAPDGTVTFRQRLVGAFSEALLLEDFPFDTQTFSIRLLATGFSVDAVRLVPDPEALPAVAPAWALSSWTLLGWEYGLGPPLVPGSMPQPASLALNLHMKRNTGYFISKVLLPLILISAMSWVVFWVAPEQAATKISVSITSMLTLIANRFMVDALVPRVSYLTRLDLFILGATVLVFFNLVLAVAASVLAAQKRPESARAIDRSCRVALPVVFTLWAVWTLAL